MTEITRGTENSRRITLSNINIVSGVRLYWQIYLQLDSTLSTEQRHSYRRKIIVITLHRFTPKNQVGPFDPSKVKNWYKKKIDKNNRSVASLMARRSRHVCIPGRLVRLESREPGRLARRRPKWLKFARTARRSLHSTFERTVRRSRFVNAATTQVYTSMWLAGNIIFTIFPSILFF